jgi:FtsP/CotA-like multicopper oxidase with cupredoxin domain
MHSSWVIVITLGLLAPHVYSTRNILKKATTAPATPPGGNSNAIPILDASVCPSRDTIVSVSNFPGSPFKLFPFTDTFKNPSLAQVKSIACRADGHCMYSYEINVIDVGLRAFDNLIPNCKKFPATWFRTYNEMVPGPTIRVPSGQESMVRFTNNIGNYWKQSYAPCLGQRTGNPFSVHLHGSASLAPYDGWAEDETCRGESKDYVYPNNRPTTGWYHDHALHITSNNAYYGLAGMYIITSSTLEGGCGEPWNLQGMEEKDMILSDKLVDTKCQQRFDTLDTHKDNFYGDINLVSGIPFPKMPLEPKQYRFRLLNAAVTRPYLVKIKTQFLQDVMHSICQVIASDGGYASSPIPLTSYGLRIGVAERYEIVCDFSNYAGQTLYLWNDKDPDMMKDVPYFCYSHLLSRLDISAVKPVNAPVMDPSVAPLQPVHHLKHILTDSDITTARQMIAQGKGHRRMAFGRTNGHWTINGETWESFKIAAADVGHNTWELWEVKTGGGWFHPIHMHLIDFFILEREGAPLQTFEAMTPKDVMYLGPSNTLWMIARYGAHKGDYMFHCHNLRHEDNDMMRAYRVIDTNASLASGNTNDQFVLNELSNIIYSNYKYADPMLGETAASPTASRPAFDQAYIEKTLESNLYRIFYPLPEDDALQGFINPWKAPWCSNT